LRNNWTHVSFYHLRVPLSNFLLSDFKWQCLEEDELNKFSSLWFQMTVPRRKTNYSSLWFFFSLWFLPLGVCSRLDFSFVIDQRLCLTVLPAFNFSFAFNFVSLLFRFHDMLSFSSHSISFSIYHQEKLTNPNSTKHSSPPHSPFRCRWWAVRLDYHTLGIESLCWNRVIIVAMGTTSWMTFLSFSSLLWWKRKILKYRKIRRFCWTMSLKYVNT